MLLRKNDSGRSIVEMLGVLAIMGVITVMGISGYSQAIGRINRNKVVEDVNRIIQEVRGLFAGKTNAYTEVGDMQTDANAEDLLTSIGFRRVSDQNPFGGVYQIGSSGKDSNDVARTFTIKITGLNRTDCNYLRIAEWQGSAESPVDTCTSDVDGDNELSLIFD